MGLELLPYLAGRRLLLLVDAVRTGAPPTTVVQMEIADPSAFFREKISPHQIGIAEVLSVAALTNELPGRMVLIGVVPKEMATGLDLSPEIAAKVGVLADMVAAELGAAGFSLARREAPRE
jgi:hydrogenase maturation protease